VFVEVKREMSAGAEVQQEHLGATRITDRNHRRYRRGWDNGGEVAEL